MRLKKDMRNLNKIIVSLGTFRNLYVKNQGGEIICTINCSYDNKWTIAKVE